MLWILRLALLGSLVVVSGLWLTRAKSVDASVLSGLDADLENGARVFAAMGCASCHKATDADATGAAPPILAGGKSFVTPFGTFMAPNISSDPTYGLGGWSDQQIASAVLKGTAPDGTHYYPAFPYASYAKTTPQDIVDLIAHLRTLPADPTPSQPHSLSFPFNIRASLGGWKLLFAEAHGPSQPLLNLSQEEEQGRYLVEVLGHCAECHTPRNRLGGLQRARWLAGAPNPSGKGNIPNITPAALDWSVGDIAEYLSSGFTPEFDTAGGSMAEVIENTARLTDADRLAIAAYLKRVPAVQ
ncbi:MAG: mono/diheme cytochrome c family protein [Paracoccaceae bacterium]|jgi:mono/diheme cytochrome c family protein